MLSDDGLYWDADGIDPELIHQRLFEGAIARLSHLPAMSELVAFTRRFLEAETPDPTLIYAQSGDLADRCATLQRRFANAPEAKRLWRAVFEGAGLDPEETVRDRLMLRFQPPQPAAYARSTATVGFHRDTWGTNLAAQVNWWAPVYPIDAGRTFAFLPELFAAPLANDSAGFDIAAIMRRNRGEGAPVGRGEMAPKLTEPVDLRVARAVTIAPGEVILFSSQHAHFGVENRTGLTRISLETRTLRLADIRDGRGAPNVDGRAKWIAYSLFRRVSDGTPLNALLGCAPLEPFAADLPA